MPYDCPELPLIESEQSVGRFYEAVSQHRYAGLQRRELHSSSDSLLTDPRLRNFELIISDNASTDQTGSICQSYADRDARIRYVRSESNCGASPNHKRVFEMASGEYFKWAAHDDECLPTFLSRCMDVFGRAPQSLVLVYPQALIIDEEGRAIQEYRVSIESKASRSYRRLARVVSNVVLGTPVYGVIRANALKQTRLIDAFFSSDYILFAELAMLGEIWELPELLLRKRFHPARSMAANKTAYDNEVWLNPQRPRHMRLLSPCHKLALEYLRSAWRLPLSPCERVICSASSLFCHYPRHSGSWVRRCKRASLDSSGVDTETWSGQREPNPHLFLTASDCFLTYVRGRNHNATFLSNSRVAKSLANFCLSGCFSKPQGVV